MAFKFENTKPEISNDDLLDDLKRVGAQIGEGDVLSEQIYRNKGK